MDDHPAAEVVAAVQECCYKTGLVYPFWKCSEPRFRDFYVCRKHFEELTEPAILRMIAWG